MTGLVKRFARNAVGRDILVGDIHGCFGKLQAALDVIAYNDRVDRLFSVGDLVDRGPQSNDALEWLKRPDFHAVPGNHEEMAIMWSQGLLTARLYADPRNGGEWNATNTPERSAVIAQAFAALPVAIELETGAGLVGIVHAECPTHSWQEMVDALQSDGADEREEMRTACLWSRRRVELAQSTGQSYPVQGVRAVVSGHTPMRNPTWISNHLYIDTGACFKGAFTLIDADTLVEATLPRRPVPAATEHA